MPGCVTLDQSSGPVKTVYRKTYEHFRDNEPDLFPLLDAEVRSGQRIILESA